MQEHGIEIELSIGDVLQIGGCLVTVVDIDGPEVSFRIEGGDSDQMVLETLGSYSPPAK